MGNRGEETYFPALLCVIAWVKRKGNFKEVDTKKEGLTVRFASYSDDTEEIRVVAAVNLLRV